MSFVHHACIHIRWSVRCVCPGWHAELYPRSSARVSSLHRPPGRGTVCCVSVHTLSAGLASGGLLAHTACYIRGRTPVCSISVHTRWHTIAACVFKGWSARVCLLCVIVSCKHACPSTAGLRVLSFCSLASCSTECMSCDRSAARSPHTRVGRFVWQRGTGTPFLLP